MKKYIFQITKKEVRELYFSVIWGKQIRGLLQGPGLLLAAALLAILAVQCITYPLESLGVILLLLGILGAVFMRGLSQIKEQLCKETRIMWIEEGMLKTAMEDGSHSEFSCDSISAVQSTPSLLMLGIGPEKENLKWYPIPLRIFADGEERDSFLESIRNCQGKTEEESRMTTVKESGEIPADSPGGQACGELEQAPEKEPPVTQYFRQSYGMGEEEWVRMTADATEVIQAETLGKMRKGWLFRMAPAAAFIAFTGWVICRLAGLSNTRWMAYAALAAGAFPLLMLRNYLEKPEKAIRRQLLQETVLKKLGDWEIAVTETGINQNTPDMPGAVVPWESLLCMVETDTELFFFKKDTMDFHMLMKEKMEDGEIEALKELCREKNLEILSGKRRKYASKGTLSALTVFAVAGVAAAFLGMIWEGGDPACVSFEEQVSDLRSLGFPITEEMEESWSDYIEENELNAYVEAYPYTALLMDLAWYNPGGQEGAGVFWFDFEGWAIDMDYIRILEGMQGLAPGSILDGVENIREDTEKVDWEEWTGTIVVSLEWEGQEHSWEMDMENDWIDAKVLGIYNGLLEKEGIPDRFYFTDDGGQGALVFYCTEDWASAFERVTHLEMEAYTVSGGW